jgi:pimeloyl-ACP methyl ester carboxylesterase
MLLRKIFLTGHSMGGYVTLAFADLFPEKLKDIVFYILILSQIHGGC